MIGYEELHEKYQKLLDENKRLRIENEYYQAQLGLAQPNSIVKSKEKKK